MAIKPAFTRDHRDLDGMAMMPKEESGDTRSEASGNLSLLVFTRSGPLPLAPLCGVWGVSTYRSTCGTAEQGVGRQRTRRGWRGPASVLVKESCGYSVNPYVQPCSFLGQPSAGSAETIKFCFPAFPGGQSNRSPYLTRQKCSMSRNSSAWV